MLNSNIKIDLHIHSQASQYKETKGYMDNSNVENINILLEKLQMNKINMFSFTDHNRFDYNLYKKAVEIIENGSYSEIKKVLPGVEFDVELEEGKGSCHIICIFEDKEQERLEQIEQYINEVRLLQKENEFYTLEEFERIIYKIGLSTIFIAHQKTGLDKKNYDTHSLSECVEKPEQWIKTGFINALEYKKPRVQGMIKKNLHDFKAKFATITGSDCHVWSEYPNKDSKYKTEYITKVKCLPNFKGLLFAITSPETRFDRKDNSIDNYISTINLGEKKIELSTGINAIIGDNASGKSLLLNKIGKENLPSYYDKIVKENNIKIIYNNTPEIEIIKQGDIIEKVKRGELFNDKSERYYINISTISDFKTGIENFIEDLKKYIYFKIDFKNREEKINSKKIEIKEFTNSKNYYPSLNIDIHTEENNHELRLGKFMEIYKLLEKELQENKEYYEKEKILDIEGILEKFRKYISLIEIKNKEHIQNNKIKNIIINVFNDNDSLFLLDRTSQENEKEEYLNKIRNFAIEIIEYIKYNNKKLNYPKFPAKLDGKSVNSKLGMKFTKKAKYDNLELEGEFYGYIFKKGFRLKEEIEKIEDIDTFVDSVAGVTDKQKLEDQIRRNVDKFIVEYLQEETYIQEENGTNEIGSTPGEIALTFYKLILNEDITDKEVILIDQPEDDISVKRIEEFLINYLNKMRDKKQIIFVTHNPLLVVNLDVDNLIFVNKRKDNMIEIKSGCLESDDGDESIIDIVGNNLDGGYAAVERRLKIYGS